MPPILQPAPIDIATWREDEEFFRYPEGARVKRAVFPAGDGNLEFLRPERRHLFKKSRRAFPDQYWAEVVAYHVGSHLGIDVPPAYAAWDSRTGECGALIEWFYVDGQAAFVPGGLFMQQFLKDYDRKVGRQHNFHTVRVVSRTLYQQAKGDDWQLWWAKTFLFDALIGNTDRHQDNWGFLFTTVDGSIHIAMAPCYDHGTALGHERFTDRVAQWKQEDYERYISKGRHHMKWLLEDADRPGMVEMVAHICAATPRLTAPLVQMVGQMDLSKIEHSMTEWGKFALPVPLDKARWQFMLALLKMRLEQLRNALV